MIFDVGEIPDTGLEFDLREKRDRFDINQSDCFLSNDVIIHGTLRVVEGDGFFNGTVKTELTLTCSRCLEPFKFKVDSKVSAHYVPLQSTESEKVEHELHEADIDLEVYRDDRINVKQVIHDQIILSAPVMALCREDCKGLCPTCGANKNKDDCQCAEKNEIDPRLVILKSIKDKLKP
jgi:uncharacterized protein